MRARQEHTQLSPGAMFKVLDARVATGSFDWHYHDDYEIVLIESGTGTRYVGDSIEEFETGELVLIGAGLPHAWSPSTGGRDACTASVVHIAREKLPVLAELDEVLALLDRSSRGVVIPHSTAPNVVAAMRTVWSTTGLGRVLAVLSVLDAAASLQKLARPLASVAYAHDRKSRPSAIHESRVETVFEYVRYQLGDHVSQASVAKEVGLTPSSFSRLFKRETGRTFTAFVQEMRVSEACALLAKTDLGVASVAYRVGFRSLAHFNKVFLRLKERTPSEWRDAHAKRQDHRRARPSHHLQNTPEPWVDISPAAQPDTMSQVR